MRPHLLGFVLCAVTFTASYAHAAEYRAQTAGELAAAVAAAAPGDEVVIADGRYDTLIARLDGRGEAGRPITIRPETEGGVVFTGQPDLRITGAHLVLTGLVFEEIALTDTSGIVYFDGAQHCRLTRTKFVRCSIERPGFLVWFRRQASDNRVDHCEFIEPRYRSIGIQVDDEALTDGPPARNQIDHNVFRDVPPKGSNGGETIQIGSRAHPYHDAETATLIEHNLFLRCDGESEIISDKTTGNIIRHNVFVDCEGHVVMRHGNRSVIESNTFLGGLGGIRISGAGHVVRGNTIVAPRTHGILLFYGVEDEEHPAAYLPAIDNLIENNVIIRPGEAGIFIGAMRDKRWHRPFWAEAPFHASPDLHTNVPPHDNTIRNNVILGPVANAIRDDHAPANITEDNLIQEAGERDLLPAPEPLP